MSQKRKASTSSAKAKPGERAFWSANKDFAGLVKCTNTLIRLEHARSNWSGGLPLSVDKMVGRAFDSIRLPAPTPWLNDGLQKLKTEMAGKLHELVTRHLSDASRDITSSYKLLDQKDADVAHQTAVRQLRRSHGSRIKQASVMSTLSALGTSAHPVSRKQTVDLAPAQKKKKPTSKATPTIAETEKGRPKPTNPDTSSASSASTSSQPPSAKKPRSVGSKQSSSGGLPAPMPIEQSEQTEIREQIQASITAATQQSTNVHQEQQRRHVQWEDDYFATYGPLHGHSVPDEELEGPYEWY